MASSVPFWPMAALPRPWWRPRRLLHHNEPRPFQALDQVPGRDIRHQLRTLRGVLSAEINRRDERLARTFVTIDCVSAWKKGSDSLLVDVELMRSR